MAADCGWKSDVSTEQIQPEQVVECPHCELRVFRPPDQEKQDRQDGVRSLQVAERSELLANTCAVGQVGELAHTLLHLNPMEPEQHAVRNVLSFGFVEEALDRERAEPHSPSDLETDRLPAELQDRVERQVGAEQRFRCGVFVDQLLHEVRCAIDALFFLELLDGHRRTQLGVMTQGHLHLLKHRFVSERRQQAQQLEPGPPLDMLGDELSRDVDFRRCR
mmetsp:Transcript_56243/g.162965  ORF Transcript_56243/g.162965 Transcript_56243/m.162965 type:complete len:220 (-) Transcript_56243:914-1573(-)